MTSEPPNRSIRDSDNAAAQYDAACAKYDRLEQAWIGITWRLARGPEAGTRVGDGSYLLKFTSYLRLGIGVPSITVLYSFDDSIVDIHAIRFSDED